MASQSIVKKRQAKATQEQIDYMVDYFVQFPHVATGKFKTIDSKANLTGSWEQLSKQLNDLRSDGKMKDVKSWKATWRNNKTLVSQKISKIRASQAATGNVGNTQPKLTEREEKILGLMGFDYVEGVDCPDAFPEEVPGALELLAAGQEDVGEIAVPLTLRAHLDESVESQIDYEVLDVPVEVVDVSTEPSAPSPKKRKIENVIKTPTQGHQQQQPKLGTQLGNARDQFAELAERQISCMEMIAGAMQQMAENDRRRNEILQSFLEMEKRKEDIFQSFMEMEKKREETVNALVNTVQDCVAKLNGNT